ncbi:rubrerythrin-like domain-containing protein [Natribaculum luteum]|uniref:Rubrerythrin-like domain-containing protein n=1 Tax=Natribaculum luteum TaxID=1586232 RepID=A0ABD5P5Z1_9EURY
MDAEYDPKTESTYECLDCGNTVLSTTHPGECPVCGATFRNRSMPLE